MGERETAKKRIFDPTRLVKKFQKWEACEQRGGHFEGEIIDDYHPKLTEISVRCSRCGAIYDRPPTAEEKEGYRSIFYRVMDFDSEIED